MPRRLLILAWIVLLTGTTSGCDPRGWFVCALGACGVELDSRAPFPPQDPRAVAFSRGVALDWKASLASDVSEYRVYRSTTSAGPRTLAGESTTTSFRDTGLANGTTYFYVIRAADALERESTASREVSATPQPNLAPAPPAGLTATASEGAVDLLWAESFTATLYNVWRSTTRGGPYTKISSTTATASRDAMVAGGTTYYYAVNAENADGVAGALTPEVSATPGGSSGLTLSSVWGGVGSDPGRFDGLVDVAVDRFDNVYTLEDFPNWRVQRFTAAGAPVGQWQVIGDNRGIAVDFAGDVYVTNAQFDRVQKYAPDGTPLRQFGQEVLTDVHGIATDGELVYVADEGGDRIQIFSISGAHVGELAVPGLDGPRGIAVDRRHAVHVVDGGNARVRRVQGATVTTVGGPGTQNGEFARPHDVAVDAAGIWVTDAGADRVQAFAPAGAWRTWFGGSGSDAGRLEDPRGIAADCAGALYVADAGNERVQKFAGGASSPCAPTFSAASASRAFRGSFKATRSRAGTLRTVGGKLRERAARQRGTFRLSGVPKLSRGRWYALFDVTAEPLKLTARARGRMLAVGRARRACLTFTVDVAGGAVRGRFRGAARGTFRQRVGRGRTLALRGTGTPGKASTARCKTVVKAFRLR